MRNPQLTIVGLLLLLLAWPSPAWAYIDPGASSIAFQILIGGVLAFGFALRRSWKRLADLFNGRRTKSPLDHPPGDAK